MGVAVERGQNHRRTGLTIDYTRLLLFPLSAACHCLIAQHHRRGGAPLLANSHPTTVSVSAVATIQGFEADQLRLYVAIGS
ncbi:unnamed protein product [Lactuca virosa]|uniref:Uncharacterized protein n=1 Tax=Lactuca virosa TaxID=75947 RepID=A0AAU9MZP5_9ASTR|nr:unnamed protein product [Lactuca virosa]